MRSRSGPGDLEPWRRIVADVLLGLAVWTALLLLLWTVGFWTGSWYEPWFLLVMGFVIASLVGLPLVAMATGGILIGADMRSRWPFLLDRGAK